MLSPNTTPADTQKRVQESIQHKGRKAVDKANKALESLRVEYVPIGSLKPNDYNPNRQGDGDFELLQRSITEDGFTQPIVVLRETRVIVDGEHRWRAANSLGFKEIPVVFVDMTPEQARISTLRHNRARGSEDMELTAQVLRDLEKLGAIDWAQDSLMMSDNELMDMLDDIATTEALAGEEYTEAWEPALEDSSRQGHKEHVGTTEAYSDEAARQLDEQGARLEGAQTQDEREAVMGEYSVYRLSLEFEEEEATMVRSVMGAKPAETILQICREEAARKDK